MVCMMYGVRWMYGGCMGCMGCGVYGVWWTYGVWCMVCMAYGIWWVYGTIPQALKKESVLLRCRRDVADFPRSASMLSEDSLFGAHRTLSMYATEFTELAEIGRGAFGRVVKVWPALSNVGPYLCVGAEYLGTLEFPLWTAQIWTASIHMFLERTIVSLFAGKHSHQFLEPNQIPTPKRFRCHASLGISPVFSNYFGRKLFSAFGSLCDEICCLYDICSRHMVRWHLVFSFQSPLPPPVLCD